MIELNDKEFPVKAINNRRFSIGDTSSFGEFSNIHRVGYDNHQHKIMQNLTFFIVGIGAIGCEQLKKCIFIRL
ncbi:hypothetical protein TRFO_17972 [Tritrichomonas foetus]|uniref:Uncharacterized protein n=1 Tax=Tritrichomonas foetus TaxID=1144522 RepID=A0A1J4KMB4_9EUKA|nr:hypothetical protein TRFO_17972 [Tritrichomonas foetus]|eukprot:OHT12282.1 hypothetical protein TRFO_17972 [Tritrichomonas foetus]